MASFTNRLLICLIALLGFSSISTATQIAYEGFNYSGSLNGQNGGSGFGSNAWTAVTGYASPSITTGSLTYSNGGNTLVTTGNKLQPALQSRSTRNFPSTITTANQTFWVSIRVNQTDTGTLPTNHSGFQFCDLTNGNLSGSSQIFLGKPFNSTNWGFQLAATVSQKSGAVTTADRDALLVYKLVFTSTQVTCSMWVDPPLTSEAAMGSPAVTNTVAYAFNFASMWVGTGNNSSNYQFDEFRFGTVFANVVPTTLIASEDFNYTGNLNTKNGGTGFGSNAWTAVASYANPVLTSGSLTYSNGGNTLVTSGNKVQPAVQSRSTRNFPTTILTGNQTFWVSFRANQTDTTTLPTNHAGFQFCDLTNGGLSGTSQIFLGKPFNATNWGFQLAGTVGQKAGAVTAADRDALLVYKLVFTSTQVTCSMWIDPPLTSEAALGTPALTSTVAYAFNFASMWLGTGNNSANYQFDEFRFATNFAEVTPYTASGTTFPCFTSADFTSALSNAQLGDTIILQAGNLFTGTFTLANKPAGSGYITIQSSNLASLPATGTRVNLSHASNMPKIQPANVTSSAIITQPSAHHYKLLGLEVIGPVGDTAGGGNITYPIINLGTAGTAQDTLAEVPNNFIIDRCIIRANTLTQRIKRGIEINTASTDITNCYIADIKAVGQDCQAIMGYNGPGPFNIINNFIQGATENLLFGGTDASIPNLIPSDIVVAKNHFHKPLTWKVGDPSYAGIHWAVKNIFELKNAQRVTVEGNIFENNWTDGQSGYGIVFTPRNQSGTNPWVILKDITFRKNIFRNSAGYNIMGNDNVNPSQTSTNIVIENNLNYNISSSFAGNGKLFLITRATDQLIISHNTSFNTGNVIDADGAANSNFVFVSNLSPHTEYGVKGANQTTGSATLNAFFPSCLFQKNVMMDNSTYTLNQLLSFYSSHQGGWNPTSLAFPQSWTGVLVNQGTPGTDFAGWKVVAGSAYDNSGVDATGAPDGKDIGCNIDEVNAATVGCISGVWP